MQQPNVHMVWAYVIIDLEIWITKEPMGNYNKDAEFEDVQMGLS